MRKIISILFFLTAIISYSQQPFSYDTISVSKEDARNIHSLRQRQESVTSMNQQRRRERISKASRSSGRSGFDARKLRYGINLGLNFSNNYSLIRFAPQLGYQFNKYAMAGVGVSYYHSKRKYYYGRDQVTHYDNSLGANVFGYLYPLDFLAISVQPEMNYIWSSSKDVEGTYNKRNVMVPLVVVGAGLRMGPAHAMVYYDLVQDTNSPYTSGVFYGVSVYF